MSVARVTEISSTSTVSFEDAIQHGLPRATETLRQVKCAWIKEQYVSVEDAKIAESRVNMLVTFVFEDGNSRTSRANIQPLLVIRQRE